MISEEEIYSFSRFFEEQFAFNDYTGQTGAQIPFDVKCGFVPVLLSAPHATKLFRNNRIKEQDDYTGTIGLLLQRYTNCHLIYTTRCTSEDPNFVIGGEYKEQIRKLAKLFDIRYVIDLHGASEEREFDVDLGTQHGLTINHNVVDQLTETFKKYNIMSVCENSAFPAKHPGTVTAYCYHDLGLQSLQMEINKKIRNPNENLELFISMVQALHEFILTIQEN
ncbi:hypothetical protein [Halalkalibacter alkalisediminis]|uniref:N-formylglutamate amidohydrolase n=1 Tax=Halalkalibacter alkalisediminis TaxID=935616 RepID=A0ABV6NN86_9BACI